MGAAKPCLGYPSRTAAVLALRTQGMTTGAIAQRVGISRKNVVALEISAGRQRTPRPAEQMGRTVVFPRDILASLGPAAAKRNCHVNTLARRIVEAVVDENLIDAVLDDRDDLDYL